MHFIPNEPLPADWLLLMFFFWILFFISGFISGRITKR